MQPNVVQATPKAHTIATTASVLEVEGLTIQFPGPSAKWRTVVDNVSFSVGAGETMGLVGESGSGKSVTSQALLGLIPDLGGRVAAGSIRIDGREVLTMGSRELRQLRGRQASMIFQQPTRSLNPAFRVGDQIAETIRLHTKEDRKWAKHRAVELLERVRIPNAARRARDYPHQFSGGQAQRIMIAMAIACNPKVLVADEPTTALDQTVQARVLTLLKEIQAETGIAVVLISHDLRVIAEMSKRIAVMYAGEIIESGSVKDIVLAPQHPYTKGLIDLIPSDAQKQLVPIPGYLPSFDALPQGCRFHPRCSGRLEGPCTTERVELIPRGELQRVTRCVRVGAVDATVQS